MHVPASTWTLFWQHPCYWQLTPLNWVWVFFLACPGIAVYLHSWWFHVSVCNGCSSPGPLQLGESPPEVLTSASLQLTSRRSLSRLPRLRWTAASHCPHCPRGPFPHLPVRWLFPILCGTPLCMYSLDRASPPMVSEKNPATEIMWGDLACLKVSLCSVWLISKSGYGILGQRGFPHRIRKPGICLHRAPRVAVRNQIPFPWVFSGNLQEGLVVPVFWNFLGWVHPFYLETSDPYSEKFCFWFFSSLSLFMHFFSPRNWSSAFMFWLVLSILFSSSFKYISSTSYVAIFFFL